MPRIYSRTQKIHKKFITCTQPFFEDLKNREVYDAVKAGKNTILRVDRTETSDLDMNWVKRIEDCIPQLTTIVTNPRKIIQVLAEVVQVEKAKKITSESVMHLASHTQFVKKIDEEGNVTPSKILNVYNDDNIKIYENKFIATLIRRLYLFVEKRYDFILHNATMKDVSLLYYKNQTQIDDNEIEIETRVRFAKPSETDNKDKITSYLRRINEIRKYLSYFNHTEFMRIMRTERDVRNPILQTNIIRKNPTYRKCYHLWMYIDRYDGAGVDVRVQEIVYDLDKAEIENITKSMFVDYITLRAKDNDAKGKPVYSKFSPKILKTLDDDVYTFGSLYDGPIDYVRIDDKYREFMNRPKEVPKHPTKAEQAYFKDEYKHNKEIKENAPAVEALIKRREAEAQKYLKETEELFAKQRREAEAAKKQAELNRLRAQEQRIEDARSLLMAKAQDDLEDSQEVKETRNYDEAFDEIIDAPQPIELPDFNNLPPMEDDEEIDPNFVLPTFKEIFGEEAEKELPDEGLNPLFEKKDNKGEEEEDDDDLAFEEDYEKNEEGQKVENISVKFPTSREEEEEMYGRVIGEEETDEENSEEFEYNQDDFKSEEGDETEDDMSLDDEIPEE
ncbi:MAG: hypothetical protein K6F59_04680 [Gammaproteobacteria bacterium]|nr:hypothetical protein [Gammaproteobacteria bacterium]